MSDRAAWARRKTRTSWLYDANKMDAYAQRCEFGKEFFGEEVLFGVDGNPNDVMAPIKIDVVVRPVRFASHAPMVARMWRRW